MGINRQKKLLREIGLYINAFSATNATVSLVMAILFRNLLPAKMDINLNFWISQLKIGVNSAKNARTKFNGNAQKKIAIDIKCAQIV